jgi:hypothetical protein
MTDWIEHTTDTCPVDPETVVEVRYGSGLVEKDRANGFLWWMRNPAGIKHYRVITPAKPPEPEMPEPDLITLRLECLKLAVQSWGEAAKLGAGSTVYDWELTADRFLHYVLNGSVDKA